MSRGLQLSKLYYRPCIRTLEAPSCIEYYLFNKDNAKRLKKERPQALIRTSVASDPVSYKMSRNDSSQMKSMLMDPPSNPTSEDSHPEVDEASLRWKGMNGKGKSIVTVQNQEEKDEHGFGTSRRFNNSQKSTPGMLKDITSSYSYTSGSNFVNIGTKEFYDPLCHCMKFIPVFKPKDDSELDVAEHEPKSEPEPEHEPPSNDNLHQQDKC